MLVDIYLSELANCFNEPIYLVGGAVRNMLMGFPCGDTDTASAYTVEEVKSHLKDTEYVIRAEYPRTGTLLISRRDFKTELTTFRKDSYPLNSGTHTPCAVAFTRDIAKDALRRDFTVNAVYYDIKSGKYVDPTGGIPDINRRILRTVREPDIVLGEDALRVLRLIRFRAELGYSIEQETLKSARKSGYKVKDISRERITDEYLKILKGGAKYGSKITVQSSLELSEYLNCYEIMTGRSYKEPDSRINSDMDIRAILSSIYLDVSDPESVLRHLKLPNKLISDVISGIGALRADKNGLSRYIAEHYYGYTIVKELIEEKVRTEIDALSSDIPKRISDLLVTGDEVMRLGVSGKRVGELLKELLVTAIENRLDTADKQLAALEQLAAAEN